METDRRSLIAGTAAAAVSVAAASRPALAQEPTGEGAVGGLSEAGAEAISHKPALARSAAIVRSMQTLLNDEPTLRHFFTYVASAEPAVATDDIGRANADNWADVAHALRALDYRELRLKVPAGIVPIAKMDFTPLAATRTPVQATRTVLDVLGTVQLIGTDGSRRCIFGSTNYEDNPPSSGDPLFIRGVTVQGGALLIAPREGEGYRHGMQLDAFVEAALSRVYVSGNFVPAADGHRKAVKADIAFLNRFVQCSFDSPGASPVLGNSYNFWQGPNSNNINLFSQCRVAGTANRAGEEPVLRSIGFRISGENNVLESCDLSVLDTLVELEAARSFMMLNCYGEVAGTVLDATRGLNQAAKIIGGYFEIAPGKTAIKAGSTQNLEIAGGRWSKAQGASETTFIDLGSACYGRTVRDIELIAGREFDRWEIGAERGNGDLPGRAAETLKVSRLTFPPTSILSADPTTLDDYREGTWMPIARGGVAFPAAAGTYTKKGDEVTLHFAVSWPGTGSRGTARIGGLPFAPSDSEIQTGAALGYQVNPNRYVVSLSSGELAVIDPATGANVTNAGCADMVLHGTIVYKAAG